MFIWYVCNVCITNYVYNEVIVVPRGSLKPYFTVVDHRYIHVYVIPETAAPDYHLYYWFYIKLVLIYTPHKSYICAEDID